MTSADRDTLHGRLRRLAADRGISQTDLARRAQLDRSEVNRILTGKRAPRPRELAWLLVALDATAEAALQGLDLSEDPAFDEELEFNREVARRVLDAERDRDDLRLRLAHLESEMRAVDAHAREERNNLHQVLSDQRVGCADRLRAQEADFAMREGTLMAELGAARDRIATLEREARELRQLVGARDQQLVHLQRQLVSEAGNVVAGAALGALVGAILSSK